MAVGLGRSVSPDSTRRIWGGIGEAEAEGREPTAHTLVWGWAEGEAALKAALDAGLIGQADGLYSATPLVAAGEPGQDWYCFECHSSNGSGGSVVGCSTCVRVYHPLCLNMPELEGAEFSCPVCVSLEKPTSLPPAQLTEALNSLLAEVEKEGLSELHAPQLSAPLSPAQYAALVARHVDHTTIREKVESGAFLSPRHLFADLQILQHNVALVHGKDGSLHQRLAQLVNGVRGQVDALEGDADIEPGDNVQTPMELGTTTTLKPPPRSGEEGAGWAIDDRFKKMLMELQRYWLTEYQQSREKLLVELTEKLHAEFVSDQAKIRTELLTQFKDELDTTKQELEQKYKDNSKQELGKLADRHRKEISAIKKKQWCWQCEAEAIYHCCWNTAYCSVECQQAHWPTHRKYCRRKKNPPTNSAAAASN